MTIDETMQRIDALSPRAKEWLRKTCEQAADDHSWTDVPSVRVECENAGLVDKRGRFLHIDPTVQLLVYGDQYLANSKDCTLAKASVSGFWRSARGENHGRNSQPGDVWVEPGDITDTDRLNWLIAHGAFLSYSRDGDCCNVWLSHDPDDDSNGAVPAEGYPQKCYNDPRAAIDAVMCKPKR